MVDYTERRKTEREKRKMFPHYITGPPQREEVLREILIIIFRRGVFTNFIKVCHNEFFERTTHKFCSFELWTDRNLYRGRLHRERRKTEREKRKMFHHYITGPTQREEIFL